MQEIKSQEINIISSKELYEKLKNRKCSVSFRSKFSYLEKLINGFEPGELTVLSGLTKNGKTLFAQTLTKHFSEQEINCLWFSYELSTLQFLKCFGEDLPHFYMPEILLNKSISWIYKAIKKSIEQFKVSVIFIDHLHFLSDIMMKGNPSLEIGQIMRTLKSWAVELDIIIFIICHTMKIKQDRELEGGDVRDSSFIEQESDNVFYIWRDNKKIQDGAILKITANRRMGIMNKKIELVKKGNYLYEIDCQNKIPLIEEICDIEEDNFGENL